MAELGALEAMAVQGALEAMADGPQPGPYSRNSYYPPPPPPQNFPGEVRGYQEPSGAKQTGQYKKRQESPPGPDRQDRNRKPSRASSEAEASSGHDQESGALTGSLSDRLHFSDKGAGGWEWPPWPLQEPPAPDESPWTRQDKVSLKCSCGHNKTDTRHSWP